MTIRQFTKSLLAAVALLTVGAGFLSAQDEPPAQQQQPETPPPPAEPKKDAPNPVTPKPVTPKPEDAQKLLDAAGKMLKGLFGPVPARPRIQRVQPDPGDEANSLNDHDDTDERTPHDVELEKQVEQVERLIDRQDWRATIELLQSILDAPYDTLLPTEDKRWVSAKQTAEQRIGRLPAAGREFYEVQFAGLAQQLLKEAVQNSDTVVLTQVARRYFNTPAGRQAADRLIDLALDRGAFATAARWTDQLLRSEASLIEKPAWKLKAAYVYANVGRQPDDSPLLSPVVGSARLPQSPRNESNESAGPRTVAEWLSGIADQDPSTGPLLEEWPTLLGTSRHVARAEVATPLLLTQWTHPLIERRGVETLVHRLEDDLLDSGRVPLPAFDPIAVGNLIAFRTLSGIQVRDAATGRTVWQTVDDLSAERLILGEPPASLVGKIDIATNVMPLLHTGSSTPDQRPIPNLLYRDHVYGLLSSDGRRLFAVEDHAILSTQNPGTYFGGRRQDQPDPFGRDWSSNQIVAYDLQSGVPVWRIGGRQSPDPDEGLPLAGHYFHGVPIADGGELFVISERDGDVSLHCLDPVHGQPKWSQLIAATDTRIEHDIARRLWTLQPSVTDDAILCPTGVGWLVAIDRWVPRILWAHRYVERKVVSTRRYRGRSVNRYGNLNDRWLAAPPVVLGHHVLVTPTEMPIPVTSSSPELQCLDAVTGRLLWKRPKSDGLYLAGASGPRAFVVGRQGVTAVDVDNGSTDHWNYKFTAEDGRVAGRALLTETELLVPLSSQTILHFDQTSGEVVRRSHLPEGSSGLGNLIAWHGYLLSQSTTDISQYQRLDEARRQSVQQGNPDDAPATLLHQARVALTLQDFQRVNDLLHDVDAEAWTADEQQQRREMLTDALVALIRSDLTARDDEFRSLTRLINRSAGPMLDAADQQLLQHLEADRLLAHEQWEEAFNIYWEMAEADVLSVEEGVRTITEGVVTVRLDRWLAPRLRYIWGRALPDIRERIDERIRQTADIARSDTTPRVQRRFASLVPFHPAARQIETDLIRRAIDDGHFAAAELPLLQRLQSDDAVSADASHKLLDELYAKFDIKEDESEQDDAGEGGRWAGRTFRVVRTSQSYHSKPPAEVEIGDARVPYFDQHQFKLDQELQRLAIHSAINDELVWSTPLQTRPRLGFQPRPGTLAVGHVLWVAYRGVLHALPLPEQRLLWAVPFQPGGLGSQFIRQPNTGSVRAMQPRSRFVSYFGLRRFQGASGMLAIAQPGYICHFDRRRITLRDPLTGEILWTREGIPARTMVYGNAEHILVIPPNMFQSQLLNVVDGSSVAIQGDDLNKLVVDAISFQPDGIVIAQQETTSGIPGESSEQTAIRCVDARSGHEQWKHLVSSDARLGLDGPDHLIACDDTGNCHRIDLATGTMQSFDPASLPASRRISEIYSATDSERLYLMLNHRQTRSRQHDNLRNIRADGTLFTFNKQTGKLLWSHEVKGQYLILNQLDIMPVLLFAARRTSRVGNEATYHRYLLALDKQTGQTMLDIDLRVKGSAFHSITLNPREQFIELQSYNERVRLIAEEPSQGDQKDIDNE